MAVGSTFRGLSVSAAQRPTNSVPEKENAAVTKTEQRPLNPLLKAPGWYLIDGQLSTRMAIGYQLTSR